MLCLTLNFPENVAPLERSVTREQPYGWYVQPPVDTSVSGGVRITLFHSAGLASLDLDKCVIGRRATLVGGFPFSVAWRRLFAGCIVQRCWAMQMRKVFSEEPMLVHLCMPHVSLRYRELSKESLELSPRHFVVFSSVVFASNYTKLLQTTPIVVSG